MKTLKLATWYLPVTRIGYADWFLANHHWFLAEILMWRLTLLMLKNRALTKHPGYRWIITWQKCKGFIFKNKSKLLFERRHLCCFRLSVFLKKKNTSQWLHISENVSIKSCHIFKKNKNGRFIFESIGSDLSKMDQTWSNWMSQ